jgi:hypothetical protein
VVAPKVLALAAFALAGGIIAGILIAPAVPFQPAEPVNTGADAPGTVLVGADEPKATPCAWTNDPFEGMDAEQQAELTLISACGTVRGTVQDITVVVRDEARVYHFTLLPDSEYAPLANAENQAQLKGALMIEVEPQDQGIIPRLHVGERLEVQGPHVTDIDHGWNEIHPARIITVI